MKGSHKNLEDQLDFFSIFVHELKALTMSLRFQIQSLEKNVKDEASYEKLNEVKQSLAQMLQFIHDTLEIQEMESNQWFQPQWSLWSLMLDKSIDQLKEWISQAEVKIEILPYEDFEVSMDSRWMHAVVTNLLLNAIHHSPKGGQISLKTEVFENQSVTLSISDEGQGIQDENLKKSIFNKFHSTRRSSPQHMKGTGLGLFIARNIIQKHGGEIGFRSPKGKGCTFFCTLPQIRSLKKRQIS